MSFPKQTGNYMIDCLLTDLVRETLKIADGANRFKKSFRCKDEDSETRAHIRLKRDGGRVVSCQEIPQS